MRIRLFVLALVLGLLAGCGSDEPVAAPTVSASTGLSAAEVEFAEKLRAAIAAPSEVSDTDLVTVGRLVCVASLGGKEAEEQFIASTSADGEYTREQATQILTLAKQHLCNA